MKPSLLTYTIAGHYAICLAATDVNGCNGYTCDSTYKKASLGLVKRIMVVNPTSGIIEENSVSGNSVFPNPASELLSGSRVTQGEIRISDIAGREMYREKINANSVKINVSDFPAGYYTLTLESKTQAIHNKTLATR
jgi:hypothetical protein